MIDLARARQDLADALPDISKTVHLKGLDSTIEIHRDAYGTPHVNAHSFHDAFFGQGFATAQDRLWHMDHDRRWAYGRWAEYAGEDDSTWRGFIVHTVPTTESLWEELTGSWESLEHQGSTVLFRQIPYSGLVGVVQTGQGIMGVSGAVDRIQLLDRLTRFGF